MSDKFVDEIRRKYMIANKCKNRSFHITITDNKKGEKLVDSDTDCFLGAFYCPDGESAYPIGSADCSINRIYSVIAEAQKSIQAMRSELEAMAWLTQQNDCEEDN